MLEEEGRSDTTMCDRGGGRRRRRRSRRVADGEWGVWGGMRPPAVGGVIRDTHTPGFVNYTSWILETPHPCVSVRSLAALRGTPIIMHHAVPRYATRRWDLDAAVDDVEWDVLSVF